MNRKPTVTKPATVAVRIYLAGQLVTEGDLNGQLVAMPSKEVK